MPYYPIFLDISQASCLIVGAGDVGLRKLGTLLEAGPRLVVLMDTAPPSPSCAALLADPRVCFTQASFSPACLQGHSLVFAATANRAVNAAIAAACQGQGLWCNCVDAPTEGSFIVPATAKHGSLTATLSTGGSSPALARKLRQELEEWLKPRSSLAALMGKVRPYILSLGLNTAENTRIFRGLIASELQTALANSNAHQCETLLRALLPEAIHPHIVEFLDDLF
ncbi:MAG: bifunctional precorrin-2 dehydrogenase/sirohydrochlorin ferrochelatase [Desulfovibrionaceae bacterium]